jgi:hypothetical protein
VHDLHHVADDRITVGEEAGRVEQRDRIVEEAQQLVEPERDALQAVVTREAVRSRSAACQTAEGSADASAGVDVPLRLQRLEPAFDLRLST